MPLQARLRRTPTEAEVPRVHLEVLTRHMERLRDTGSETVEYVTLYQDHVARACHEEQPLPEPNPEPV